MNLKDITTQNADCRSLKSIIFNLYRREKSQEVYLLERFRSLIAKKKSDLTFLKCCRDAFVIPSFSCIKHNLKNSCNNHIFSKASQALIRPEMRIFHFDLHILNNKAFHLHLILSNHINPALSSRTHAA